MKAILTTALLLTAFAMNINVLTADEKSITDTEPVIQTMDEKIKTNLAKLPEADLQEAQTQRYCPLMPTVRLGAKGTPIKLTVEGKSVYVCCKGCEKSAQKDPAIALKKAEQIKTSVAAISKLPAADQVLAEEQLYCAVATKSRLGSMGIPLKVMVQDQAVFLCCKNCEGRAVSNPDKTLQALAELKTKVNPKE